MPRVTEPRAKQADACYDNGLRIGIHTSIAACLESAALKAFELGANTFQIFSSSPRMWRASSHDPQQIKLLRNARERFDLHPLAIHVSYLVNLASADPLMRAKSIAGFRGELVRAAAIGAEYLVLHPGSYKGQTPPAGIEKVVSALREVAEGLPRNGVTVLLENTVGCGAQLGGSFEELRMIRDQAAAVTDLPVGFCLDTCHLLAAGYDIASESGLRAAVARADRLLGIGNVKLIHANDSKGPLGSRIDRHANIGEGHIGKAGFRRFLAHPKLRGIPFILETPVEQDGDDRRNLENLKKLCPKSRTITTKSS